MARKEAVATIPGHFVQTPTIYLIDQRSNSAGAGPSVDAVKEALREQLANDFIPIWGSAFGNSATIADSGTPRSSDFVLNIVDQSQFGLGYHTYDPGSSTPFNGEITGSGDYWSITASHEVLEILINPYTSNCTNGFRLEVGDPVENLSYPAPNGVYVSDFAFPSWWGIGVGPSDQFDFLKQATAGNSDNGYIETCATAADGSMMFGIKTRMPGSGLPPSFLRGGRTHPLITAMLGKQAMAGWHTPAAIGYTIKPRPR